MAWLTRLAVMVALVGIGMVPYGGQGQIEASWKIRALRMAHLLSFATAWGAALWVTFVGGIIMFRNLPRHQFGNVQGKMFPAYFAMVGLCEAVCVGAFGVLHPWASASTAPPHKFQILLLVSSLLFTLSNLLIFTPLTMNVLCEKIQANILLLELKEEGKMLLKPKVILDECSKQAKERGSEGITYQMEGST